MKNGDARSGRTDCCTGAAPAAGLTRRMLLNRVGLGLGGLALADLLRPAGLLARGQDRGVLGGTLHVPATARRVIYLFMAGGPSQMETFDYKPALNRRNGEQLPDSVRQGQRLTGMSGNQSSLPLAGSQFAFAQHGASGAWVSELLPHTARIVDDLCIVRSMVTDAINHDPAITFFQTGSQIAGRPSLGSWIHYGLGSDTEELPAFVVLITPGKVDQPLYSRLWGSGFLPSRHQGVQFRSGGDAVLYLANPDGVSRESRRAVLDRLNELHAHAAARANDAEIEARIAQYEMAYRLQASVPGVMDLANESEETFSLYGPDARTPGTFAANCLLARRLAERGVKFIQLYHQGWDQHDNLPRGIERQCRETDRASAALVTDLKRRGMLDDTLVVWGGEFGRTSYSQGKLTATNYGRDHHPRCFTVWMAGGGVKAGLSYGATDDFAYNVAEHPVHVHDFHATLLHLLGIDHERLTYFHQGRRFRLTDVHGQVVRALLARLVLVLGIALSSACLQQSEKPLIVADDSYRALPDRFTFDAAEPSAIWGKFTLRKRGTGFDVANEEGKVTSYLTLRRMPAGLLGQVGNGTRYFYFFLRENAENYEARHLSTAEWRALVDSNATAKALAADGAVTVDRMFLLARDLKTLEALHRLAEAKTNPDERLTLRVHEPSTTPATGLVPTPAPRAPAPSGGVRSTPPAVVRTGPGSPVR